MDLWIVVAIVGLALAFDFVNGFHDAANSIATVVSTRVLSPRWAVAWAAFFNVLAYLVFELHVANTIKGGVVMSEAVTLPIVTAGLVGAVAWDLITWYWGLPTSSSHALIGGFAGAAVLAKGFGVLVWQELAKIIAFIFVAPLMGMAIGFVFMLFVLLLRKSTPARVDRISRKLQLCSAAAYSLGHGGNDAQKTMGIIAVVLIASNHMGADDKIPIWVVAACYTAMGLGTLSGGWRIVKTMGQKICDLKPVQGFAAETAGTVCLFSSTYWGIPVSTTHTITGAIFGVGSTKGFKSVKWTVAQRVVWAWVLTIPASALVAMLAFEIFKVVGWQ